MLYFLLPDRFSDGQEHARPLLDRANIPDFGFLGPGELLAWSRIFNDLDVLIVLNTNGAAGRGSRVELDPRFHAPGSTLRVVCDTARLGDPAADPRGGGNVLVVQSLGGGRVFVDVGVLPPAEVKVLTK